jgi:glycine dehydrogenase
MTIPSGFAQRHIGPDAEQCREMLGVLGYGALDGLLDDAVPASILLEQGLSLPEALTEPAALEELRGVMGRNKVVKSFIGQGYHGTVTPPVIQRNILENPGWYTAYTPYQAEIAQGRLEALLNFQTMVVELTGLAVANASLLDEGTAAAEAMAMAQGAKPKATKFFADAACHPQTLDVLRTRAEAVGVELVTSDWRSFDPGDSGEYFGALVQYPDTYGTVADYAGFAEMVHAAGGLLVVAADPLALTILREPGAFGADMCVGSTQRFGVPFGFGGPHAAYLACSDKLKRKLPGRLVGVSIDSAGKPAYRLALQTREQHIRRDKATSNICTAQVLLGVMASMYAVYHGPRGLKEIAERVRFLTGLLAGGLKAGGIELENETFFDTVTVRTGGKSDGVVALALAAGYNIRRVDADRVGVSFDETATEEDVKSLLGCFGGREVGEAPDLEPSLRRTSGFLGSPVFNSYHSETEMMRYLRRLETKDLSLNESMIPLGSCTMKLNAAAEMMPVTWPEVGGIHPFAPADQTPGYREMLGQLEGWLAEITGFAAVSLQPNAGSQGEYAGLLAIRRYQRDREEGQRDICLIPMSAHGTNPASAVMTGFRVVPVKCDEAGNIDVADLGAKCEKHSGELGALMVTYPSTHGVFEETILEVCDMVHRHGGQVYMDGANMNAQVGLTSPAQIGADVCHLNLHKTFCIPHGGGGPGVGPIGVAKHLVEFLPGHAVLDNRRDPVCAAPWGSASINVISWMYIRMMGVAGLTAATQVALLNANYMAERLKNHFPVLYTGSKGRVAHECIIDLRPLSAESGVTVEDVAKRLMDYGFHAPTMSWPVSGTLMIEPTESESKEELDRFCDAMISIHGEIQEVVTGAVDYGQSVLHHAPHTAEVVCGDAWDRPYTREQAAFPVERLREHKFWPSVGRIDNVHGDRNLVCTCEGMESYGEGED